MQSSTFAVPCHFGLESTVRFEALRAGGQNVRAENGRVLFEGDDLVLARANVQMQSGERILLLLAEFQAASFDALFEGVRAIPLEEYIGRKSAFPVTGWALHSALKSVPDCQKIIKKAAVERLKEHYHISWFEESEEKIQLRFSILKDRASIYIDTTGIALHKRGYRAEAGGAPIKETLAAGMADLVRVREDSLVIDPFCGSGTLLIESAFKATATAPGLRRHFAAERYPFVRHGVFDEARQQAIAAIRRDCAFRAIGYDNDPQMVALAQENIKKAGFENRIEVQKAEIAQFCAPDEKAIILCNPPYGERMLDSREAARIYRKMGQVFTPQSQTAYHIITSRPDFEAIFGREAKKKRKLYNGMLQCALYSFF